MTMTTWSGLGTDSTSRASNSSRVRRHVFLAPTGLIRMSWLFLLARRVATAGACQVLRRSIGETFAKKANDMPPDIKDPRPGQAKELATKRCAVYQWACSRINGRIRRLWKVNRAGM